ncbi:MAG: sigma-70 family RNA polymerase sigma factor, partial [Gammaproteobacteria bacterium]|nr:sigma-70 family RNA polymerase sigma factor [Gammaproteobacteria bacterium]
MGESNNDKELVKRAQEGDKVAFDVLVTKYHLKVVNLVTRFVKDNDDAQDVTQEAFIKAYRGLKNFRGDSAFYTWLYRIAINSAKNYLVSQSR